MTTRIQKKKFGSPSNSKEVSHADTIFEKIDYSEAGLTGEEFEDCTFRNCNFSNCDLSHSRFIDCRLIDCDLSMAKVNQTGMSNVMFLNCKIVGVDFSKCLPLLFSVSFETCCLDYSLFTRSKLKKTKFKECIIREADFTGADLTGATFESCDLLKTVFSHTNLSQADFTTARNYAINLEMNIVRKAKFSLSGIVGLLSHYDIVVE
jgi:fluoroquinolone resistance protein